MSELLTERSARIVAARKLTRRSGRDDAGFFLAEGRQAVAEALAEPRRVREVFATEAAAAAHSDLLAGTPAPVRLVTEKAAAGLSETVTPQGLVAVCALRDVPSATLVAAPPRLAVALAELADPGNAGTVLRTADACGAGAVVFGAGSADPFGGKAVRASAGSLFHVDVVRARRWPRCCRRCRTPAERCWPPTAGERRPSTRSPPPGSWLRSRAVAVRQRGPRRARGAGGAGRCAGPHPDAREGGEPQSRRRSRDLPLHDPARPGLSGAGLRRSAGWAVPAGAAAGRP